MQARNAHPMSELLGGRLQASAAVFQTKLDNTAIRDESIQDTRIFIALLEVARSGLQVLSAMDFPDVAGRIFPVNPGAGRDPENSCAPACAACRGPPQ